MGKDKMDVKTFFKFTENAEKVVYTILDPKGDFLPKNIQTKMTVFINYEYSYIYFDKPYITKYFFIRCLGLARKNRDVRITNYKYDPLLKIIIIKHPKKSIEKIKRYYSETMAILCKNAFKEHGK
jgi:hypothetical protein